MNPFKKLLSVLPSDAVDVGTITTVLSDGVIVELQSGGTIRVKGGGSVGQRVYIKAGAVIGAAPQLNGSTIEV